MADETSDSAPPMDYAEHDRTYAGFMEYSKMGVVAVLNIMIALILFGLTGAFWSGVFVLVGTIAAFGISVVMKGSFKPMAVITAAGVGLFLFSIM